VWASSPTDAYPAARAYVPAVWDTDAVDALDDVFRFAAFFFFAMISLTPFR
jgi:hypothetical protein